MNKTQRRYFTSLAKLINSFGYAFKGIWYAATSQLNFRVHLVATLAAAFMGFALNISTNEWCWVMLCITFVLVTELLNTAIEALTDLVSPCYNEKAGHVKDIAAGAVLLAAIFALATGLVVFLPKLVTLIKNAA